MAGSESGFSFVWKIENFSMLPHQLGEKLESPMFVVDNWKKVDFCLWLYPRGDQVVHDGKLSLYLCKNAGRKDLKLNFNIAVESTDPLNEKLLQVKGHVLQASWGFPQFMSLNDIYNNQNLYLPQDTLTVRCEIGPAKETSNELNANCESKLASTFFRKHCVSRTCIQVQRRSIMWSIQNVKERIQKLESTSVFLESAFKNSPCLKLTLNLNKRESSDDIPIMIIRQTNNSSENQSLFVKCRITVISIREQFHISQTSSNFFKFGTSNVWNFPPFLKISMLTDKKYLNVDDTLLLRCEFAFSYKDAVHHMENNYMPRTFETRQKNGDFSTCFENIYSSGKFCDVELKAGDKTFHYYKAVLCARSSVFAAMFENNMKENLSNVVEIEDVDPDILQMMLTSLHSDVLPEHLTLEDVNKLYRVADKYDLDSLKKLCSVLLATTVSVLNVCDLLVCANAYLDSSLMTAVSDFICSHATEVFNSAQWKSFMEDNPKLSCSVMHKMWTGSYQI